MDADSYAKNFELEDSLEKEAEDKFEQSETSIAEKQKEIDKQVEEEEHHNVDGAGDLFAQQDEQEKMSYDVNGKPLRASVKKEEKLREQNANFLSKAVFNHEIVKLNKEKN